MSVISKVNYSGSIQQQRLKEVQKAEGRTKKLTEKTCDKQGVSYEKTIPDSITWGFTGYNSFADKVSMKANSISIAAVSLSGTYKSNGTYSNTLSEMVSNKVDNKL